MYVFRRNSMPRCLSNRNACMFTKRTLTKIFIIVKDWKQLTCLSTGEINKAWHSHITKHYIAMRMTKQQLNATIWMNLTNIILN